MMSMNKHEMLSSVLKLLDGITVSGSKNVVLLSEAFQILFALQKGLKDEDDSKNRIIEELKEQIKRIEKDGAEDGAERNMAES